MSADPVVEIASGKVRGASAPGVVAFHAIPYAAPPVGALRFAAPEAAPAWTGVRDCTRPGASPPQGPSRLDAVMGIVPFAQSEDCLTLTVWTPAADGAKRPVMMWFHGGAYQSGGAHQPFYDGANLARTGDIVVVGVNYRLGALGYLHLGESIAPSNRGLLDQMAALRWVAENIASLGGDPRAITIAGQSAGGGSVYALLQDEPSRQRVRRAIAQSPSAGALTPERAEEFAARFQEIAGVARGDLASLRALSVDRIVAAQRAVQMEVAAKGDRTIAWQYVTGTASLPLNPAQAVGKGCAPHVPLLVGSTLDEGHAWLAQDEALVAATDPAVIARTAEAGGFAKASEGLPAGRVRADAKPWETLSAMLTWGVFEKPARRVATGHAKAGGTAFVYRFDWRPEPDARYGACHCIELPFMLDNLARWPRDCAMMKGHAPPSYRRLATEMREAWVAFVRTGNPATSALSGWEAWKPGRTGVMVLDDPCRVETVEG